MVAALLHIAVQSQLVENESNNLRVTSSGSVLGIGRNWSPIHPEVKWVPGIWIRLALLFYNGSSIWRIYGVF